MFVAPSVNFSNILFQSTPLLIFIQNPYICAVQFPKGKYEIQKNSSKIKR